MLLEEGVFYDQCVLLRKLLAFALLHSVLQGQICLLLQVSLDFLLLHFSPYDGFPHSFPHRSVGKESIYNAGDPGSIPGSGRSSGEGKDYPLQYSGLENSMDHIVYGVTKSWAQLSNFRFSFPFPYDEKGISFWC